jgi:hypothetical protein
MFFLRWYSDAVKNVHSMNSKRQQKVKKLELLLSRPSKLNQWNWTRTDFFHMKRTILFVILGSEKRQAKYI